MPRHPRVSPTSGTLNERVFSGSALSARARQLPQAHRLHIGDTYLDPPASARAEAQRCAEHPRLHNYSPVHGEPELIAAICERHPEVEAQQLQVMAGATGGLNVTCQSLLDPGDEVLVLAPFWPIIRGIISMRGAVPIEVPFYDRLSDPTFNPAVALAQAISPRTVALYVNSPNNPIGSILDTSAVDAIVAVAEAHDLWVFCDEAYESLHFSDEPPPSIWRHPQLEGRAVATHTLSKSHGLAGARVGYTHGPPEAMAAIRSAQTFHSYCAARPMQLAAARALREGGEWLARARAAYAGAALRTADALRIEPPQGGTFAFFDTRPCRRPRETTDEFLLRCLEAGVLLMPGANAGSDYGDWARLCFTVVPPSALDDALGRLRAVLDAK